MIHEVIDRWHQHLRGELPGGLDELLHADVVFLSPVVFTPQRGREITKLYLSAASKVLPGDKFHYVKEILDGHHAVLEFETKVGEIVVNGIDMITCDDDGKIIEFKVMVRPKKAMEALHEQMRETLEVRSGTEGV